VGRIFGLFVNLDKMIGKDFEAGLAAMKTIAEDGSQSSSETRAPS
jgi:hypothetical protein